MQDKVMSITESPGSSLTADQKSLFSKLQMNALSKLVERLGSGNNL